MDWLWLLGISLLSGYIGMAVAEYRRQPVEKGFVWGFLVGPLGVFNSPQKRRMPDDRPGPAA